MRCPFCNHADTKVVDSRLQSDGAQVRRRRECLDCTERFTTFETAELNLPRVIKSDGASELFNIDKLARGLMRALEKRPVSSEAIEAALRRIRHQAMTYRGGDVPSAELGEWVMAELRELDQVAYVRFASVYREFEDVNAFRDVIDRLEKDPSPEQQKRQYPLLDENGD